MIAMTAVRWKLVAALDGDTCVVDEWAPEDGVYPRRSHLNCDLIAEAMRAAGAEPHHWYVVRVDLAPDGVVVGEARLTVFGLPTYRDGVPSLSEAPKGMIAGGVHATSHISASCSEAPAAAPEPLTPEPGLKSFAISWGFEAGDSNDFVEASGGPTLKWIPAAPLLLPGWERQDDGWIYASVPLKDSHLTVIVDSARTWTEDDLDAVLVEMNPLGREEVK